MDTLINGEQKYPWTQSMSNELGIPAQVNDAGVKSNNCVDFIYHQCVPNDRNVTHAKFVCDYRILKSDQYIISLLVGGDKLDYALDEGSPTAPMLDTKLLVNSVISYAIEGSQLISCDLKYFFFMYHHGYIRIHANPIQVPPRGHSNRV